MPSVLQPVTKTLSQQTMGKRKLVWEIKIVSVILMISTIILIVAFQCWWINRLYKDEWNNLSKGTDIIFRDVVYKLQLQRFRNDTAFFKKGLPDNLFVFDVIDSVKEKFIDSTLRKNGERQVMISVNRFKDSPDVHMQGESTMQVGTTEPFDIPIHPPHDGPPQLIKYFSKSKTINDSISLQKIDSAYKTELARIGIFIPFHILLDTNSKHEPDTAHTGELRTNFTFVGLSKTFAYQAVFDNPFGYIIKKISLPILVSVLLIAFTIISFVFLYRNLLAQRRLAEMKNEFISNITHELKTPIATVNVAIEALRNFDALQSPERTKEYLDISAAELQRLSLLVDKVLRLSMFENRDIELTKEQFDLRVLIQDVIDTMKLQFEKYNATVNFTTAGEQFMLEADKLHITSVIYNLLDNALKYSKEKPVINVQLSALPNDILEIKVSDNGIGIASEYRQKIFDKFFRVPTGDKHNTKGYGLGLSYVSEILKRHMGFICVESEKEKGSTFIIKLPVKEAPVIYIDEHRRIIKKK
ncbi:HAMP domain-containing histidine kinase [Panacibacter ginsenosidivorans]|uniref:histidine kinase n=1 Tax=Panacibacter ginsenosidivorans TaxID=1813871 RepID=A0A5B8V9P2_9BACT|nr:HAMP domain-containing sensor histidine kinase [Panacibacter ginsenosidivorans]QEC67865.1 HAMP domain-containing histidine kinase [Panacibacter ginsenosidivorans]